ncbi:MAG TPA: glycosyltransferase family 4 protein [Gaiellales bacterium]|jgi:glycosyltransferase involved in cell wall biosynthesis|nr:glycosyltransferase family 4 protein [Gaiellales bacterium]
MRIALLAPAWFAVPPTRYGGIEWVVSILADGLVERGHDVTLFAAGDSQTRAHLVTSYDEPPSYRIGMSLPDLHHALTCLERAGQFDVVHDHSGPLACALGAAIRTPFCHTVHGPLDGEPGRIYDQIGRVSPSVHLISLSHNQRAPLPDLNWLATVHNAIDIEGYPFDSGNDGYLLFLGRMSPDKGAANAIAIAERTGLPLRLAGKMHDPEERRYFEHEVQPHLRGGIEYLGEVSHDEKVALLQRALVTLFPIQWEEPFGLVMVESMACGTPVAATRMGAVPEVITDGVSGVIGDTVDALAARIEEAAGLDREAVRRDADDHFSDHRMVADYEAAYRRIARPQRLRSLPRPQLPRRRRR